MVRFRKAGLLLRVLRRVLRFLIQVQAKKKESSQELPNGMWTFFEVLSFAFDPTLVILPVGL